MRERLEKFIEYEEGEKVRLYLHQQALKEYKQKYSDCNYLKFMNENECQFTINHAQSKNHPYYFTMFSVVSQHVMGDCVQECLDKAIEISINHPS